MPFAARLGFFNQPAAAGGNARRVGAADTNAAVTWSRTGNTVTKTAIKQFGTASGFAPTKTDRINGTATIFPSGTGDFTVEWWMYIPTLAGHGCSCDLWAANPSPNGGIGMRAAQQYNTNGLSSANPKYIALFARNQADLDYWDITSNGGSAWTTGQWYFCAVQRKSAVMSFWLDGSLKTRSNGPNGSAATRNYASTSNSTLFGANDGNGAGPIYFDDFCVSPTFARYEHADQDIPVPSAPFTVDEYTSQLLHFDGADDGTSFPNDEGT